MINSLSCIHVCWLLRVHGLERQRSMFSENFLYTACRTPLFLGFRRGLSIFRVNRPFLCSPVVFSSRYLCFHVVLLGYRRYRLTFKNDTLRNVCAYAPSDWTRRSSRRFLFVCFFPLYNCNKSNVLVTIAGTTCWWRPGSFSARRPDFRFD